MPTLPALTKPKRAPTTEDGPRAWVPKTGSSIWEGAAVGRYPFGASAGYIDNMGADSSLICEGVARHNCGTLPSGSKATFADSTLVDEVITPMTFPTGLTTASRGALVYAGANEIGASLLPVGPPLGQLIEVDSTTVGRVGIGPSFVARAKSNGQPVQFKARAAVCVNVADIAAFTVAAAEATFAENDIALLTAQTTGSQNGPWRVGPVTTGVAALTRPWWWAGGSPIANGIVIEVSEGLSYPGSSWKAMCTGACVVGTDDPILYPKTYKQTVTLASGTYKIGLASTATPDEPLFLLTGANVQATRNTVGGTVTSTIDYAAPDATRAFGKAGTAALVINAVVAAGTVNSADTSTIDVLATNW